MDRVSQAAQPLTLTIVLECYDRHMPFFDGTVKPWVAKALMETYASAMEIAESYYEDPNWSRLAWGRHYYEQERDLLGVDPWPIGFAANKVNLKQFIKYSHDQGLISERYPPERLFVESTLDT